MKYVMLENSETGAKHAIVFGEYLIHSIVAHGVCREYRRESVFLKPVSAGFTDGITKVYGVSESLGLESVETDIAYIVLGSSASSMPVSLAMLMYEKSLLIK